jgi:hypothetical protein
MTMQIKTTKKITRSTAGLRDVAFDALEQFLNGGVNADHLKAINGTISTICQTVALDLKAADQLAAMKKAGEIAPPGSTREVAQLNLNIALCETPAAKPAHIPEK